MAYTSEDLVLLHINKITMHLNSSSDTKCVSKLIFGSDNGMSPGRWQAIIWANAGILSNRTSGANFDEILSEMYAFSFTNMHLKMYSAKMAAIYLNLNVLR